MPLASFLFACAHWALWAFLPILLEGDPALAGRITAIYQLTSAIVLLPAGWFTDRWSPRALCFTGAAFCAAGSAAFSVPDVAALAATLSGIGSGLFLVSLHALVYKRLAETGAGASMGRFVAAGLLGYAAGPLIGGQFAGGGLGVTALVAAALFCALGVVALLLPGSEPVPVRPMAYLADLRSPGPLLLVGVIVLTSSHGGVEYVGLPTVAAEHAGLSPRMQGVFYALTGVWTALLTLRIGRAFDRSPRPVLLLAVGTLISGLFQGLTGLVVGFGSLIAIRLAHTVGDSLFGFCIAMLTSRVFPKARVGGLFALTQFVRTATMGVSAAGTGALEPHGGIPGVFALSGLLLVGGGLTIALFRRDVRRMVGLPPEPAPAAAAA